MGLLLALYLLALGPINLAYRSTDNPRMKVFIYHAVRIVYWPIDSLTDNSKTAFRIVDWYTDLWLPARENR